MKKCFFPRSERRNIGPFSPLLFNFILIFLASATRQEKEINGMEIRKEEVKAINGIEIRKEDYSQMIYSSM